MRFEWDENKNRSNYAKHGVWFEEAQTVWVDSESVEFFDPEHSSNEDRFIRVGHREDGRINYSHYLCSKSNNARNESL